MWVEGLVRVGVGGFKVLGFAWLPVLDFAGNRASQLRGAGVRAQPRRRQEVPSKDVCTLGAIPPCVAVAGLNRGQNIWQQD